MQPEDLFIHELNKDANRLNKMSMNDIPPEKQIPINNDIYERARMHQINKQRNIPQPQHAPVPTPQYHQAPVVQQAPQAPSLSPDIIEKIGKLDNIEKAITRIANLIEKRIASNAKDITIKIRLNNDDSDSRQDKLSEDVSEPPEQDQ